MPTFNEISNLAMLETYLFRHQFSIIRFMESEFENSANPPSHGEVSKSTATIIHERGIGSGFFIEKNLLVTNYHVVENVEYRSVFSRTQVGITDNGDVDVIDDSGDVVVTDAENDLAIIRTLRSDYTPLEMGNDEGLKMGDDIFVIGSPLGLGGTFSKGIISTLKRDDRIQIDASVSPGSSGSPVFSKDFKVIGIVVSSTSKGQNLNFAIPVSKLQELMQKNKAALEEAETEEVMRQAESSFGKELASYENKKDKTLQDIMEIGFAYYSERNYQKAFHWFEKVATQGDAIAQHNLGVMYSTGEGVLKDYKKAFYWHQKSATQGNAIAQYNLGVMYSTGKGVVKDHKKALYWYQKAADQECTDAQYNLGVMYGKDEGAVQDYKKALYWLEKAADQGHLVAQNSLGLIYYNGGGVVKDYKKALYWYQKAAGQGDAEAQNNLGFMYREGKGVAQDHRKAFYWYQKAADQRLAKAQMNLAVIYYFGEGVAKNYVEAYKWAILSKAQKKGDNEEINKFIDCLGKLMTPSQIAEAQKLADQFQAQGK